MKIVRWLDGKIEKNLMSPNGKVDWLGLTMEIFRGIFILIVFLLSLLALYMIGLAMHTWPIIPIVGIPIVIILGIPYLYTWWRARSIRIMSVLAAEKLADTPDEIRVNQSVGWPTITTTNINSRNYINSSSNKWGMGQPSKVVTNKRPIKKF